MDVLATDVLPMKRHSVRRRGMVVAALAGSLALPRAAVAQAPSGGQLGFRVDALASRAPSLQGGVGGNIPAGLYVRLEATVAGGVAVRNGSTRAAARADAVARFVLDPLRESPRGLYGIGGLSLMYDGFERWRPRLVAGIGLEGKERGGRALALELALGGGARLGLVVRRARQRGR